MRLHWVPALTWHFRRTIVGYVFETKSQHQTHNRLIALRRLRMSQGSMFEGARNRPTSTRRLERSNTAVKDGPANGGAVKDGHPVVTATTNRHALAASRLLTGDFKPQYVCALVFFVVRAIGMGGSALAMPEGTPSFLLSNRHVLVVFVIFMVAYFGIAIAMRRGFLSSMIDRRATMVVDLLTVSAVNIWAASLAPVGQLDVGGNDLFWMAATGGVAVWGALKGPKVGAALLVASGVVVVLMFLANGDTLQTMNWAYAGSRVVFAAIGLIATTVGLQISEMFEQFRREQGHRAGEEQALGAMHRRALQDLKIITRLAHQPLTGIGFETGSMSDSASHASKRLREIEQHASALAEYVRGWPLQNQNPSSLTETISAAVREAEPNGIIAVKLTGCEDVSLSVEALRAIGEAVGEATRNVTLHGKVTGASVVASVAQQDDQNWVVCIVISDHGSGFDISTSPSSSSIGLSRIVTVIEEVGGSAVLHSVVHRGTTWTLTVPTVPNFPTVPTVPTVPVNSMIDVEKSLQ
jgi:signal transduction histidine kinase